MYLHTFGTNAYGSYYTESQSITTKYRVNGFRGSFDGKNLKLGYGGEWDRDKERYINQKYITGTLSDDIVFRGKHNSKNINLSLANTSANTMKIFTYFYGDSEEVEEFEYGYYSSQIIYPKDYNEKKLINDYNSIVETIREAELKFGYDGTESSSESISYIDDRIIIIHGNNYSVTAGGRGFYSESYDCYALNSKLHENAIKLSDFIANPKDRRLLSLIRDKFYQFHNWDEEEDARWSGYDDFDSFIAEEGGIENYDFLIYPQGTIKILFAPYDSYYSHVMYLFEAAFTFEELKPFIKRGSPLDYLFN